jgi:hypothetical protein
MWWILPRSYSHRFPASRLALSGLSPLEIVNVVWLMITPSFSTTEEDTRHLPLLQGMSLLLGHAILRQFNL